MGDLREGLPSHFPSNPRFENRAQALVAVDQAGAAHRLPEGALPPPDKPPLEFPVPDGPSQGDSVSWPGGSQ